MKTIGANVLCFQLNANFPSLDVAGSIPASRSFIFNSLWIFIRYDL
jgi:hypothetical protein